MEWLDPETHDLDYYYDWAYVNGRFGFRFPEDIFHALARLCVQRGEGEHESGFRPPTLTHAWGFENACIAQRNGEGMIDVMFDAGLYRRHARFAESLAYLTPLLNRYSPLPRSAEKKQLLLLEGIGATEEMAGGALSVTITAGFSRWLREQTEPAFWRQANEVVLRAAKPTWSKARIRSALHKMHQTEVRLLPSSGQLVIETSAHVSIGPYAVSMGPEERGYQLVSNNIDSWVGQAPFLATLAYLHERARNAGL